MEENNTTSTTKFWYEKIRAYYFFHKKNIYHALIILFVVFFVGYLGIYTNSPADFPLGSVTTIHSGDSLQEISNRLKDEKIIKSIFVFRSVVILFGGEHKMIAGDYLLDKKENSLLLAYRFMKGSFHMQLVKITIPEGWCVYEIGDYLETKLVGFDKKLFESLAEKDEGYLFPDTYFISPVKKPQDIIDMMKANFQSKIASVQKQITASGYSKSDVIKMASILEGEAMPADRQVVAGILWKRINDGMPLQVDSTFKYINGKNSYTLTASDLKINSPYNTYVNKGLPPTPINNPGIQAIVSAMTPTPSDYLYFLTEKNGTIHYAKTFAEHVANKNKYLK